MACPFPRGDYFEIARKLLSQFQPNLLQSILGWRGLKFVNIRTIQLSKERKLLFTLQINIMIDESVRNLNSFLHCISDLHWINPCGCEPLPNPAYLHVWTNPAVSRQENRRTAATYICHCGQCLLQYAAIYARSVCHHQVCMETCLKCFKHWILIY